jgi:hypothetical protein
MVNDMSSMTLGTLFDRLHGLMVNLVKDIDSVIEDNKDVGMDSVRDLREHITARLSRREEIEDNQKILKLLNLFSEDSAALEIIREDSEEWIELLDAIGDSIGKGKATLTPNEQDEIKKIRMLTSEIKQLIRKDD